MTSDIRQRLDAQPFVPFVVHTADWREYNVPTPDHAHVPNRRSREHYTDEGIEYILPALLISGVKVRADGESSERAIPQPAGA